MAGTATELVSSRSFVPPRMSGTGPSKPGAQSSSISGAVITGQPGRRSGRRDPARPAASTTARRRRTGPSPPASNRPRQAAGTSAEYRLQVQDRGAVDRFEGADQHPGAVDGQDLGLVQ